MQEVFEKIIEKLEEKENEAILKAPNTGDFNNPDYQKWMMKSFGFKEAMKIVQEVAEEYNNGWIPCSVEMPEEYDSIFIKLKGTDKWNDAMFEKTSDVVNVTVVDVYGNRITTVAHTVDGKWHCDLLRINKSYQIIAWNTLPEPYQPKGE